MFSVARYHSVLFIPCVDQNGIADALYLLFRNIEENLLSLGDLKVILKGLH